MTVTAPLLSMRWRCAGPFCRFDESTFRFTFFHLFSRTFMFFQPYFRSNALAIRNLRRFFRFDRHVRRFLEQFGFARLPFAFSSWSKKSPLRRAKIQLSIRSRTSKFFRTSTPRLNV